MLIVATFPPWFDIGGDLILYDPIPFVPFPSMKGRGGEGFFFREASPL
jgi:hypothetical protein